MQKAMLISREPQDLPPPPARPLPYLPHPFFFPQPSSCPDSHSQEWRVDSLHLGPRSRKASESGVHRGWISWRMETLASWVPPSPLLTSLLFPGAGGRMQWVLEMATPLPWGEKGGWG